MVAGRRYTDEATLEVMKMTLAGQVSVDVASAFRIAGVPALCTTGMSAGLIDAKLLELVKFGALVFSYVIQIVDTKAWHQFFVQQRVAALVDSESTPFHDVTQESASTCFIALNGVMRCRNTVECHLTDPR